LHQSREGREIDGHSRRKPVVAPAGASQTRGDSMTTKKGLRDRAMPPTLLGCGLRPVPRSLPLRWPTFSSGITDGASSIGSARMARVARFRCRPCRDPKRAYATSLGGGAVQAATVESGLSEKPCNRHRLGKGNSCPRIGIRNRAHNSPVETGGGLLEVRIDGNDYGASSPR
jgi:hypothetical protein